MADWDVIAKQRLTEDWAHAARGLPAAEPGDAAHGRVPRQGRRHVRRAARRGARAPGRRAPQPHGALTNRRSPWVRLEAIRNLRVLATGLRGRGVRRSARAAAVPVRDLASCSATSGVTRPTEGRDHREPGHRGQRSTSGSAATAARSACCVPPRPDDPPDLLRGREVQLVWDVDALFAWTLDEFEDYLASERYALPTTPRVAATEDLGLPVVDIPSEALRKGNELVRRPGRRACTVRSTSSTSN